MLETLIFTGTCGKSWLRLVEHFAPLSADANPSDILHSGAGPFLLQHPIDSFSQSLLARDELRMVVFCESPAAFIAETGTTALEPALDAWCDSAEILLALWRKHRNRVHLLNWRECCAFPEEFRDWLQKATGLNLEWPPDRLESGGVCFKAARYLLCEGIVKGHRLAPRLWREIQAASQPLSAGYQGEQAILSTQKALDSITQAQSLHHTLVAERNELATRYQALAYERDALVAELQKHKEQALQTHEMLLRELQEAFQESEGFFAELETTRTEVESLKVDLESSRSEVQAAHSTLASEREALLAELQKQKEQALQTHEMLLTEIHSAHIESEGFFEEWKMLEAATDFHHLQVGAVSRGEAKSSPTHSHLDFSFERLELFTRRWPRLAVRLVEHNGYAGLAIFDSPADKDRPLYYWKPTGEEGGTGYMLFVPTDKPALDSLVALPATDLVLIRCLTARILGHISVHGESPAGRWSAVARRLLEQIEEIPERLHYDSINATPIPGHAVKSIEFAAKHLYFRSNVAERFCWTWKPGTHGGEILIQENEAFPTLLLGWPLEEDVLRLGEEAPEAREHTRSVWNRLLERDRAFLRLLVDALPDCIHHLFEQHTEFKHAKPELTDQARILRRKLAALSHRRSAFKRIFAR